MQLQHGAAVLVTSGNTRPWEKTLNQEHLPLLVAVQWIQKLLETVLSVGSKSLRGPHVH